MKTVIAPSLLAAPAASLGEAVALLPPEVACLHLDIMDGRFVPNLSFGPHIVAALREKTAIEFDAHLMTAEPERLIQSFRTAGADSLTVHFEACPHLHRVLEMIREAGMKAGAAVNPGTPAGFLEPVLPFLDRVLVMTVNPGYGGQKAILTVLNKIVWLKDRKEKDGLRFEIQADGGVNLENLGAFLEAGTENLVVGSALYARDAAQTRDNIARFLALIEEYECRFTQA